MAFLIYFFLNIDGLYLNTVSKFAFLYDLANNPGILGVYKLKKKKKKFKLYNILNYYSFNNNDSSY